MKGNVQLCVCEFAISSGNVKESAKLKKSGGFLIDRRVEQAVIVDRIEIGEVN